MAYPLMTLQLSINTDMRLDTGMSLLLKQPRIASVTDSLDTSIREMMSSNSVFTLPIIIGVGKNSKHLISEVNKNPNINKEGNDKMSGHASQVHTTTAMTTVMSGHNIHQI